MVVDKADAFRRSSVGDVRRSRGGGDGAWLLLDETTSDPTLLDVIQTYFVDNARRCGMHTARRAIRWNAALRVPLQPPPPR